MPGFNRVTLIGNLTRDPETKTLPSGTTLSEFGLAVSRHYKTAAGEEREDTCFLDCTAFGKQAEVIQRFCTKGKPLFVEGRLKYDQWDDKNGGGKRSKISVVVENFQFLGSSREDNVPRAAGASAPSGLYDNPNAREDAPAAQAPPNRRRSKVGDAPIDREKRFNEADIPF
jgi:single-strand DNA-binding protein